MLFKLSLCLLLWPTNALVRTRQPSIEAYLAGLKAYEEQAAYEASTEEAEFGHLEVKPGTKEHSYGPITTPEQGHFLQVLPKPPKQGGCEDKHDMYKNYPIVDVVKAANNITDGHCFYDFYTSCSMAAAVQDYAAYAVALGKNALVFDSSNYPEGFHRPGFTSLPDVFAYDSMMCEANGYLDLPPKSYDNYTLLNELAEKNCNELREQVPDYVNITHGDMCMRVKVESQMMMAEGKKPYAEREHKMPTRHGMKRHMVWKCNLQGHVGAACDMAYCQYNYCRMPDGRIGQGKQCNKDWLDEKYVREKWTKAFSKARKFAEIPP